MSLSFFRYMPIIATLMGAVMVFPTLTSAGDAKMGFDVTTIERFVREQVVAPETGLTEAHKERLLKLQIAAHLFRRVAAADTPMLPKAFPPLRANALTELIESKWYARAPTIWRYFFRYTLTHVGRLNAPVSRVGYYNPLADGWVITDWRWSEDEAPLFEKAYVVTGEVLRGEPLTGAEQVSWTTGKQGPLVSALQEGVQKSAHAFIQNHPLLTAETPPAFRATPETALHRELVELKLIAALLNINRHYEMSQVATHTQTILKAFSSGEESLLKNLTVGIGPQVLHRIAGLPTFTRTHLELAAYYPTPKGAVVVFAVPMIARTLLVAHYVSIVDKAPPEIDGLVVFDITSGPVPAEGG